eukprot:768183-Hanusia_phi.AAC.2
MEDSTSKPSLFSSCPACGVSKPVCLLSVSPQRRVAPCSFLSSPPAHPLLLCLVPAGHDTMDMRVR